MNVFLCRCLSTFGNILVMFCKLTVFHFAVNVWKRLKSVFFRIMKGLVTKETMVPCHLGNET